MENEKLENAMETIQKILGYRDSIKKWELSIGVEVLSLNTQNATLAISGECVDFCGLKKGAIKELNRRIDVEQERLNNIFLKW